MAHLQPLCLRLARSIILCLLLDGLMRQATVGLMGVAT